MALLQYSHRAYHVAFDGSAYTTMTGPLTPGSTLVFFAMHRTAATPSDTGSHTWTQQATAGPSLNGGSFTVWTATNSSSTSGVTFTSGATDGHYICFVAECEEGFEDAVAAMNFFGSSTQAAGPTDTFSGNGLSLGVVLGDADGSYALTTPTSIVDMNYSWPQLGYVFGSRARSSGQTETLAATSDLAVPWGAIVVSMVGGAGPQTVNVDPAVVTWTAVQPTITPTDGATGTVSPAVLAWSGIQPTLLAGGAAIDPATITWTAVEPTLTGSGTVTATVDPAVLDWSGSQPTIIGGTLDWAFEDTFDSGLGNWSQARWRSGATHGLPGAVGYVDSFLGNNDVIPPNDVVIDDGVLWIGAGSQNYGDTSLRCNQPFEIADQAGVMEFDAYIPVNDPLFGWPHVVVSSEPYPSPSAFAVNSNGPTPRYGFDLRLNVGQRYNGQWRPTPSILVWDDYDETEYDDGIAVTLDSSLGALTHIRVEFTATTIDMWANDEPWFSGTWALPPELTRGWVYLACHNHASIKYRGIPSTVAVFDNVKFDGQQLPVTVTSRIPDNIDPFLGTEDDDADDGGVTIGWHLPSGSLTIPDVPGNIKSAKLLASMTVSAIFMDDTTRMVWSMNGHASHSLQFPEWDGTAPGNVGSTGWVIDVPLSEVVEGDNTVTFNVTGISGATPYVGNVGLLTEAIDALPGPAILVWSGAQPTLVGDGSVSTSVNVGTLAWVGAQPTLEGSGTATVAVDAANVDIDGVQPTLTGGPGVATIDPGVVAWSGIQPSLAGVSVSVTIDTGFLTFVGMDPTPGTGEGSGTVLPAILTWTGVDPTFTASGSVTSTVDPATVTWSGVDVVAGGAQVTVAIDPAIYTFTPEPVTTSVGTATIFIEPGTLTFTGIDPDALVGAGYIDAATLHFEGVDPVISTEGDITITMPVAVLVWSGRQVVATVTTTVSFSFPEMVGWSSQEVLVGWDAGQPSY